MTKLRLVSVMAIAALLFTLGAGGAEQKHRYIFVYTVAVLNPNESHAMYCLDDPHCNDVYNSEERHEWFDSLPEALKEMNQFEHPSAWTVQFSQFVALTSTTFRHNDYEKAIGLYEVKEIPAKLVQVGTEKHPVQKTVEEDVPVMEWQVKP